MQIGGSRSGGGGEYRSGAGGPLSAGAYPCPPGVAVRRHWSVRLVRLVGRRRRWRARSSPPSVFSAFRLTARRSKRSRSRSRSTMGTDLPVSSAMVPSLPMCLVATSPRATQRLANAPNGDHRGRGRSSPLAVCPVLVESGRGSFLSSSDGINLIVMAGDVEVNPRRVRRGPVLET